MKIRLLAAILSALLAVALLAGCESEPVPTETQASRQLFQVDITADAPEVADIQLEVSVPLAEAPGAKLTEAEAIVIALEKAGVLQEQVTDLKAEYDADDGKFEVEFHFDGWEYDYHIHAEIGEILKAEKEQD